MSDVADQRFAPPQAQVADVVTEQVMLAGRGIRLVAVLIDGLIAAAIVWALGLVPVLGALIEAEAQANIKGWGAFTPVSMLVGIGVFLLVQGWPLLTRGQTVGKMLCKLRIVNVDGGKPDAWRLFGLRYGIGFLLSINTSALMVYSLIDALLIFRESRQCLHDSIAGTRVIQL